MNKIFIGKQVKHFAFPLLIKIRTKEEQKEVSNILQNLGYKNFCCCYGEKGYILARMCPWVFEEEAIFEFLREKDIKVPHSSWYYFYLDQIDEELIIAITSVCSNKRWQPGEPFFEMLGGGIFNNYNELRIMEEGHKEWCFKKVKKAYNIKRPEIYEICRHFGYYLHGKEIKKIRKTKR